MSLNIITEALKELNNTEKVEVNEAVLDMHKYMNNYDDIKNGNKILEVRFEDLGDGHGNGYGVIFSDICDDNKLYFYVGDANGQDIIFIDSKDSFSKVLDILNGDNEYEEAPFAPAIEATLNDWDGEFVSLYDPYYDCDEIAPDLFEVVDFNDVFYEE